MHLAEKKSLTFLEWLALGATIAAAVVVAGKFGLNGKSTDAFVYTVILFAALAIALRSLWKRRQVWRNLALAFSVHALLLTVALLLLPKGWTDIPAIILIPAGFIEGLLLLRFVWKRTAAG